MPRPPYKFRKFVGQKKWVNLLLRQLKGAKSRCEPFPTACFQGPSGSGKTLLATSLAEEFGTAMILGYGYETVDEIATKLQQLNDFDFLFINEAHNLKPQIQELLYHVINNYELPEWYVPSTKSPKNSDEETIDRTVRPSTIALATDQPGQLNNALVKRIDLSIRLGAYKPEEMKQIVDSQATELNLLLTPQAARLIARISAGVPRKAKQHLRNLRRHFPDLESSKVEVHDVRSWMKSFGINGYGLDSQDREYLELLRDHGRASLATIAYHLGCDAAFVSQQIEPVLRRQKLISISSGGRHLTPAGEKRIQQKSKK